MTRSNTKETLSFRLPKKELQELDALADSVDRNRSEIIGEAIRSYMDVHRWQIEEIGLAVAEADRGEFATRAEVKKSFAKLKK